jgi:hypothetical protein
MYEKQNFYAGNPLTAVQLNAMEDGILEAQCNIEPGKGDVSTQQMPRPDKVTQAEGEVVPHFSFTGIDGNELGTRIQYGAVGNYSASMNGRSAALNKHAFAINNSTVAKGEESFAQGYETIAEGNSSSAMGSKTWAKGVAAHTEGLETITEADGAHAEGGETKAKAQYSHAEGYKTIANARYSHSEGSTTQTGGFSAHAEGNETIADTNASHSEGSGTKVISYQLVGESGGSSSDGTTEEIPDYNDYDSIEDIKVRYAACAHAEGNNSVAMGYSAHAEGVGTKAYGRASHTEGWGTQTGELTTRAEGDQVYKLSNSEKGLAAHADGYNTKAIANYSHASGLETIADQPAQTVVGKYNKEISSPGSVFVVGGGLGGEFTLGRRNAFEVIHDGTIYILWEGNYYSLNNMLNLIANAFVKGDAAANRAFFDAAKKKDS